MSKPPKLVQWLQKRYYLLRYKSVDRMPTRVLEKATWAERGRYAYSHILLYRKTVSCLSTISKKVFPKTQEILECGARGGLMTIRQYHRLLEFKDLTSVPEVVEFLIDIGDLEPNWIERSFGSRAYFRTWAENMTFDEHAESIYTALHN